MLDWVEPTKRPESTPPNLTYFSIFCRVFFLELRAFAKMILENLTSLETIGKFINTFVCLGIDYFRVLNTWPRGRVAVVVANKIPVSSNRGRVAATPKNPKNLTHVTQPNNHPYVPYDPPKTLKELISMSIQSNPPSMKLNLK